MLQVPPLSDERAKTPVLAKTLSTYPARTMLELEDHAEAVKMVELVTVLRAIHDPSLTDAVGNGVGFTVGSGKVGSGVGVGAGVGLGVGFCVGMGVGFTLGCGDGT